MAKTSMKLELTRRVLQRVFWNTRGEQLQGKASYIGSQRGCIMKHSGEAAGWHGGSIAAAALGVTLRISDPKIYVRGQFGLGLSNLGGCRTSLNIFAQLD